MWRAIDTTVDNLMMREADDYGTKIDVENDWQGYSEEHSQFL